MWTRFVLAIAPLCFLGLIEVIVVTGQVYLPTPFSDDRQVDTYSLDSSSSQEERDGDVAFKHVLLKAREERGNWNMIEVEDPNAMNQYSAPNRVQDVGFTPGVVAGFTPGVVGESQGMSGFATPVPTQTEMMGTSGLMSGGGATPTSTSDGEMATGTRMKDTSTSSVYTGTAITSASDSPMATGQGAAGARLGVDVVVGVGEVVIVGMGLAGGWWV